MPREIFSLLASSQKAIKLKQIAKHLPAYYLRNWLSQAKADTLYQQLLNLPWQSETLMMYGKEVCVPRKILWIADDQLTYCYSGKTHHPEAWPAALKPIREKLKSIHTPNAVLANYYQDGKDYMGWHSDNEKELGPEPIITSLSLGAPRTFKFRHKKTQEIIELELEHGSLLVMHGSCQQHWQHCLPKRLKVKDPRVNLTFREVA